MKIIYISLLFLASCSLLKQEQIAEELVMDAIELETGVNVIPGGEHQEIEKNSVKLIR